MNICQPGSSQRTFPWVLCAAISLLFTAPLWSDEGILLQPAPRWWKGNLHTHTLWSDGNEFPEMVADWYRTHGYHFLALSDHNILSDGVRWMEHREILKRGGESALQKYRARFGPHWVETRGEPGADDFEIRLKPLSEFRALVEERGRFLMIPGEEISDMAEGLPVHLNATNLKELIQPLGGATIQQAMEANVRAVYVQAKRTGREMLVHLNHPNFYFAITAEDLARVVSERFYEVYNGHPAVRHLGDQNHPGVERIWDIANTLRIAQLKAAPLMGLAVDDSHEYYGQRGSRPGRGWIMVRSRYLTPESLIRAMKRGDFYASSGVTLRDVRFDVETGKLEIEIEPREDATFITEFIGTPMDYEATSELRADAEGEPLRATRKYSPQVGTVLARISGTNPSYSVREDQWYVRAVITSSEPHPDPSYDDQKQRAWTQPVGWQRHLPGE